MPATIGLKKASDRAIIPALEAVRVPAHVVPPGSPQLCHLHPQLSLGQSCHRQKTSCTSACVVALVVSYFLRPWRLAYQASLSGSSVLQARIQERVGQYWFPWLCGTGVALRRYPTSKVREAQQDGGAGATLRRYPMSKGREAPARH